MKMIDEILVIQGQMIL